MAAEVLDALKPKPGGRYADGTVGGAGHAVGVLAASSPTGWLSGCDRDGAAIEAAQARLAEKFAGRFEIRRGNFVEMDGWIPAASCDGVLLDLGVSSPQLDSPARGFSFQQDGPLDMRMDDRQSLTAADLVNGESAEGLAKIFWEYGGERESRRLGKAIVHDRATRKFGTTRQLAELIERISSARRKKNASGDEDFSSTADCGERRNRVLEMRAGSGGENFEARRAAGGHHVSFTGRPRGEGIWP